MDKYVHKYARTYMYTNTCVVLFKSASKSRYLKLAKQLSTNLSVFFSI